VSSRFWTRALGELGRGDAAEFGGKSANLGELLAAGIPVPPGFAISAAAYREGFTDALREELAGRYDALGAPAVAVRSSALGEDSEEASAAGQQESYLWVRGVADLCRSVEDCWASLHSERAVAYRARMGGEAAMGVTVQTMVDAEVSGVLFTCNPLTGDPSMVAVNASWGLGLAVVGGEANPDDFLVSKVTGEVVRRSIGSKEVEYVAGETGPVLVDVPPERRELPCLGDDRLAELVDLGKRIERHFGGHQDVEWSIDRAGALHTLQARPVTTSRDAPAAPTSAIDLVMNAFGVKR
jgi:pyruvate,water dikinase